MKIQIEFRVLITGFFNAGKTTLIHTLDPDAFSIETPLSKYTKKAMAGILQNSNKETTTTGFDRGVVVWARKNLDSHGIIVSISEYNSSEDELKEWITKFVELKGVPGQLHFSAVREAVSIGMDGAILLIDGTEIGSIGNAIAILEETKIYMKDKPILLVANKSDLPSYVGEEEISNLVGEHVYSASALYNIGIKEAIIEILERIERKKAKGKLMAVT